LLEGKGEGMANKDGMEKGKWKGVKYPRILFLHKYFPRI